MGKPKTSVEGIINRTIHFGVELMVKGEGKGGQKNPKENKEER